MRPMLCVPVKTEVELETLLSSDGWVMQQKLDGVRALSNYTGTEIVTYNRKGEVVSRKPNDTPVVGWFDSEVVKGQTVFFDYFPTNPPPVPMPLTHRLGAGSMFLPDQPWASTYDTPAEKRKALEVFKELKVEGVVFKRKLSRYQPGKRSQDWRKYKFVDTADVIVSAVGVTGPLSIGMAMIHDGKLIDVGSVKTQPEVLPHLKVGTVIEVKYLYATDSNKLYQPVWGCLRPDKDAKECTTDQLKYTNKDVL